MPKSKSKLIFLLLCFLNLLSKLNLTLIATDDFLNINAFKNVDGIFENINLLKTTSGKIRLIDEPTAKSCSTQLKKVVDFSISELKLLGFKDQGLVKKNRTRRSIRPIGSLLAWISGVPDPDSWDREVEMTNHINDIVNKEADEIISIQKSVKQSKIFLNDLQSEISNLANIEEKNSVNFENESKKLNIHTNAGTFCEFGKSIAETIREEIFIVKSIVDDSRFNIPNLHLFPINNVDAILDKKSISKKYIRDYYRMNSAITTTYQNIIYSTFSVPVLQDFQLNSTVIYHLAAKNYHRLAPLEIISGKPLDIMLCGADSRKSSIISSHDLESCQKSLTKDFYICKKRQIVLKNNSPELCLSNQIAKVVVFQMDTKDEFLIEGHSGGTTQLICNNAVIKSINITKNSLVNVPKFCSLENLHFTINKSKEESVDENLDENFELVKEFPALTYTKTSFHPHSLKNDTILIKEDQKKLNESIADMDKKNEILENALNNNTDILGNAINNNTEYLDIIPHLHWLSGTAVGICVILAIIFMIVTIVFCILKNAICGL